VLGALKVREVENVSSGWSSRPPFVYCGMTGVPGIESKPEFAKRDVADLRRVRLALEDVR
jgi:hypothetical protein